MKRAIEILGWLTAVALFAFAGHAVLAADRAQEEEQQQQQMRSAVIRQDARGAQEPATELRTREHVRAGHDRRARGKHSRADEDDEWSES